VFQKIVDFFFAHLPWVPFFMVENKLLYPAEIGRFRSQAVMPGPQYGPDLVHQFGRVQGFDSFNVHA
jgi:hypothetical protein